MHGFIKYELLIFSAFRSRIAARDPPTIIYLIFVKMIFEFVKFYSLYFLFFEFTLIILIILFALYNCYIGVTRIWTRRDFQQQSVFNTRVDR